TLPDRRVESRCRRLDGLWTDRRTRDRRRARGGAVAQELPPLAERPRRSAHEARPLRRGPLGARARRVAHPHHTRAPAPARARRGRALSPRPTEGMPWWLARAKVSPSVPSAAPASASSFLRGSASPFGARAR